MIGANEAEKRTRAVVVKVRRIPRPARGGLYVITLLWLMVLLPVSAMAATYAAYVMDARTGKVLHQENANARLHPASLTKMMTLYVVFEAVERGEISLDKKVRISRNAAAEPPSKLGLRAGQTIRLRYLIRAAAVKSANDASTALAEAISGSEAAFIKRMNRTARAMGMKSTTFRNAHGLTQSGHLSTARDMSILGRHLLYDYPAYYHLFSRRTADAGTKVVPNTNRRLLANYRGADGIKTGYTRAAGYNLVASAERGNERVIATVFGGKSTASRNAQVARLLDLGFRKAPSRVRLRKPRKPAYRAPSKWKGVREASAAPKKRSSGGQAASLARAAKGAKGKGQPLIVPAGKIVRVNTAVSRSLRPLARPVQGVKAASTNAAVLVALKESKAPLVGQAPGGAGSTVSAAPVLAKAGDDGAKVRRPRARPLRASTAREQERIADAVGDVVGRISTSGGRHWGVSIGHHRSRAAAEHALIKTALAEINTLEGSLRKVVKRKAGYDANFLGMTRESADLACRRLAARKITCTTIGPG